jgi:hypothetical protein
MSHIRKVSQSFKGLNRVLAENIEKKYIAGIISKPKSNNLFNLLTDNNLTELNNELIKIDKKDNKITFINEDLKSYHENGDDIIKPDKKKKNLEINKIKILPTQDLTQYIETDAITFYNIQFINAKEVSSNLDMIKKAVKNKNYKVNDIQYKAELNINIINNSILNSIIKKIKEKKNCKIQIFLKKEFVKELPERQENELILSPNLIRQKHHKKGNQYIAITGISKAEIVYATDDIRENIKSLLDNVNKLDIYNNTDSSGYTFNRIDSIGIKIFTLPSITGGSYIPTPIKIANAKSGIINIKNDDQLCFKYCMLYHSSDKSKNTNRISVLNKLPNPYNFDKIRYPTSLKDIEIFQDNNKIKINIYNYEDKKINVEQLGNTKYIYNDEINLLLLRENDKAHYVYIKKIENLVHMSSLTKLKDNHYCPHCRDVLKVGEDYKEHVYKYHYNNENNYNIEMPKENECISFSNYIHTINKPYSIYADFECSIIKNDDETKIGIHQPNSIGFFLECYFDKSINKYYTFDGIDCAKKFMKKCKNLYYDCLKHYKKTQEINITKDEEEEYNNDNICYICHKEITKDKNKFICVETKKYLGCIHNNCSYLNYKNSCIPIIMHNAKGYDTHLILSSICDLEWKEKLSCIPLSTEKFLSFQIGNKLKIIDSCSFLAYSLDSLIEQTILKDDEDPYKNFVHMKPYFNNEELELLCKKNVYPYEYISSIDILQKEGYPTKDKFFSNMKGEVDENKYLHGQKVYTYFKCKKLYHYHHLYLKVDVLSLASIFSNFRNVKKHYNLDPCWYISMSQFSLDAYLYYSKKKIPLIHKLSMLTFVEQSIRGGYCHVGQRVAKANNPYMLKPLYKEEEETSYIVPLDINALYPTAMTEYLPDGNYKWLNFKNQEEIYNKIINTEDDSSTGFLIQCDFEFDESTHDYLKEFVPCPENIEPPINHFSDYQNEIAKHTEYKPNKKKLIASLLPHKNYIMHYRLFKFLHSKNIKPVIKKVLSFNQSPFMKDFILFNHNLRMQAKKLGISYLEKIFKLISNALYGKMLQNQKKQMSVVLCNDDNEAIKNFGKPEFKSCIYTKSTNGLYIITHNKYKIKMNKPLIIGSAILDISKLIMYNFHYNVIHPNFEKYNIIYGDTDSIYYHIYTKDFYKWMTEEPQNKYFDLSNNPIPLQDNKDKLGKMKVDTGEDILFSFIALAPKVNAYKTVKINKDKIIETKEILKSKGTPTDLLKRKSKMSDYENTLLTNDKLKLDNYTIRSFNQELFSVCQKDKIVLNSMYDKMEILDNNHNCCRPFGYKYKTRIKEKIFNNIEKLKNINIKRFDKLDILLS